MKIRANVVSKEWTDLQELWLFEERGENELYNLNQEPNGSVKRTKVEIELENPSLEPFIRLRGMFAREAFPAIVEALSKSGFERPSESTLRGRCEAMGAHLQDMRRLLKLDVKASAARIVRRKWAEGEICSCGTIPGNGEGHATGCRENCR